MEKWKGKIAVVTGGSSGIGAAIVKHLINSEITTIILDINEPNQDVEHFYKCDLSNLESIKKSFALIEEKFKSIHILINNAGLAYDFLLHDTSEDATEKIIKQVNVNFLGVVHCAREGLRMMLKSSDYGMIINTCSVAGITNLYPPIVNIYSPTKHAIRSFSEVLRQELAFNDNTKIRVTNLCPGVTQTNIFESFKKDSEKVHFSNILDPNDIAEGVIYVLSTPYSVNVSEITIRSLCEHC